MKELQTRLLAVQKDLKAPKSQYNQFGKYRYRKAEDILEAVKPLLAQQGITLVVNDDIVFIEGRFYIKATATVMFEEDSISVSAFAREGDSKSGMDPSQLTGATSSYARKYALNGLFCIDDTADADQTNTHASSKKEAIAYLNKANSQNELIEAWNIFSADYGNDDEFRTAYMKRQQALAYATK